MRRILCVSVHPDDETLGCGGTLLKHKANGDVIYCVHVTNGNEKQESVICSLKELYGFKDTYQLGLPEIELTDISLSEIIAKLSVVIRQVKPDYLYIPNRSDAHSDHRIVFEALTACTKSFRYPFVKKIMMCEVISETDFSPALPENIFIPNVFVDVSDFIERKCEILSAFRSELLASPYTRSIDAIWALSKYRGSQINVNHAEAFMLLKEIC
jgi:N-acetylglucosaminylphosphatidylinositol deacetylase superfamily